MAPGYLAEGDVTREIWRHRNGVDSNPRPEAPERCYDSGRKEHEEEDTMRRRLITVSVFALVGLVAICITFAATGAFHPDQATASATSAATTCATKHCPANTHCCIGCTGGVVCVKNGVPCPECAPQ